jgi:GNAT superfamily N-acetyltransferase
MLIREYKTGDAPQIVRLFFKTVRSVNLSDYSEEQVRAWAPVEPDASLWHERMARNWTFVAECNAQIAGFAELTNDGLLLMLYCHKDFVRNGIGTVLYQAVELKAHALQLQSIRADVSLTAYPFFLRQGFHIVRSQDSIRSGVTLRNYLMEKPL